MGWVVAVIVAIVAAVFLWWPKMTSEPVAVPQSQGTQQEGAPTSEMARDPRMAGTWQSQTDPKFTREFRADGVVVDRYEGEASAGVNGSWEVVDPAKEALLVARAPALSGVTVIKMVWENGVEVTYLIVNTLDDKSMTTTDVSGSGSVTVFSKR
jgi:hypothetical protein